jgi:hypothetical protein
VRYACSVRALVVFFLACGGAPPPKAVGNRAAPPPKPSCGALVWNRPGSILRCTPGLFPTAGFYVELADGESGIVSLDGSDLVAFTAREPSVFASVRDCATVDLDGDGVDEIVETMHRDPHEPMFGTETWLGVRRLRDGALVSLTGPYTSVTRQDLGACRGDVRLAGRTIVVTVETVTGIPPSDCLAAGTHTFALTQSAIVETH